MPDSLPSPSYYLGVGGTEICLVPDSKRERGHSVASETKQAVACLKLKGWFRGRHAQGPSLRAAKLILANGEMGAGHGEEVSRGIFRLGRGPELGNPQTRHIIFHGRLRFGKERVDFDKLRQLAPKRGIYSIGGCMQNKPKYEKPVLVELSSETASGDACTAGNNPAACKSGGGPTGVCDNGSVPTTGSCQSGGTASGGSCNRGIVAKAACTGMGLIPNYPF